MSNIDRTWAETQIESLADGSLTPEAERRMRALIASDPELAGAVERARALRRELREIRGRRVPRGLWRRLWQIPAADRPGESYFAPVTVLATVAVAALGLSLFLRNPGPSPEEIAQQQAIKDFAVATAYLQQSMLLARNEVNQAVGTGVLEALAMSRGAMIDAEANRDSGDEDNVD
jgi:anti-sigma factor RsiW